MSKHTEGPWILSEYEVRHPITLELRKGCEIFCKDNNMVICEIPDYHFHAEDVARQSADARLLTAAPDLLEALEDLYALISTARCDIPDAKYATVTNAAVVIARARGEA